MSTSESTYKTFAIVGAGPSVGLPIVRALLARNVQVVVLTRSASTREFPAGARVAAADYSDVAAVSSVLREHNVDVVVSALSADGFSSQKPLADASKIAGVKLFVPSEYGMPTEGGTDGIAILKSQFAEYLKSIELPSARIYNGLFHEYVPWLAAVPETGKFLIVGSGKTPASYTAIEDVAGFLAHVLTTLSPSKLHNASFRIEGERGSLSDVAKLYEGKAAVEYTDAIPAEVPDAPVRNYLQHKFEEGAASTGFEFALGRDGKEPAGSSNALWEGHHWKTLKEVLKL
ncbi:hypothetical protein SERLA73DRAFT_176091 [Serpula lacrymans var. lacrymans S7.3]|uniref:NmrA-like domain-containing protein n=2 Tax=Serpula lacrymans var. lacrymans TaxID=341189 RepID=F8PMA9_SERL3|nr:uncharacterized protein SERLADRAFT_458846 [Serpula lacrymans var. lacrymans S7.9]EGO02741.1 hypothetical protein SERLA73DRAFT_176091 [Serpula lacrymans var. lacrymans S7.3]EGO28442.1 hypothetical protein SERLADRAFT_458846 [Serpula lacrymans var. lacrymans S7.9]